MTELSSPAYLKERVESVPWYQRVRLPGGIDTPGQFDTVRELARVPFPASLTGMRCLDVGTADGFWAFQMEQRGAEEVMAIDVLDRGRYDWPGDVSPELRDAYERHRSRLDNFEIAHEALQSSVQRRELTVYELTPATVGQFDFVFIGSLLLHVRDPIGALASIRSVLRDRGEILSVDALSPPLTLLHPMQAVARLEASALPLWWAMNLRTYRRIFGAAGFEIVDAGRPFFVKHGPGYGRPPGGGHLPYARLRHAIASRIGILHSWVRARPISPSPRTPTTSDGGSSSLSSSR